MPMGSIVLNKKIYPYVHYFWNSINVKNVLAFKKIADSVT